MDWYDSGQRSPPLPCSKLNLPANLAMAWTRLPRGAGVARSRCTARLSNYMLHTTAYGTEIFGWVMRAYCEADKPLADGVSLIWSGMYRASYRA